MPELMDGPAIFVVIGAKEHPNTTVGQILARTVGRCAYISTDVLQRMLEGGTASSGPQDAAALRLHLHHASLLAKSFLAAGYSVVIEDLNAATSLEELASAMQGQAFYGTVLERGIQGAPQTPDSGLRLDTADRTPYELAEEILRRVWREGRFSA